MRTVHLGFLLLVLLLAACVPKHRVVVNGAGVAIGAPLGTVSDGPFRLLFGGPRGASSRSADVTLAFSRSVPTTDAPAVVLRDDDGRAVEGTWQWFGESAAVFHPERRLALATTYRVEPRRLTAVDGSTLEADSTAPFTFTTERPALERVTYEYDEKKNAHLVNVTFDQAVTARSAATAIRIEDGAAKKVAFQVIDESQARTLTLQADASIARLDNVFVVATTALRGAEGPLGPVAEARLPLEGLGPFEVKLECKTAERSSKCDATEPIRLELTRDVVERDLLRHLSIAAPATANPEELEAITKRSPWSTNTFDLGTLLSVEPGKKYRVTLKRGLVASDKERLASDRIIEFETSDLPPSLAWRDLDAPVMVAESARKSLPITVFATNVPAFDVVSAPLDERGLARFLATPKSTSEAMVRALPKSVVAKVDAGPSRNESRPLTVDIAEGRAAGAAGAWVIASRAPGLEDSVRLLTVTDLGVNTKWSPHGALVWVTRLSTAEPVAGATISLRRLDASSMNEVFATRTDREGIAMIPAEIAATFLHEEPAPDAPAPVIFVKQDADWTFVRLPELDASLMSAIGDLYVDRGLYRPGETVLAKGYFRLPSPRGLVNLAGKTVYLEAHDAADHVFFAQTTTLDAFGSFSAEVAIPKSARMGRSFLRARVGSKPPPQTGRDRWSRWASEWWPARDGFLIDSFRTPEFKVEAKADRESLVRGETVTLTTTGTYLLGAPMTNVPVNVEVSRRRTTFTPPGLEAFSVSDFSFGESPRESDIPRSRLQGKLDSAGHAIFSYPFPPATTLARPESYTFDVDISDVSHAFSMSDTASVLVHPSDVYLGIRANLGAPPLVPGKNVRAELVAAGIDGARRAGLMARIELFQSSEKGEPAPTRRSCTVTTDREKLATCDLGVTVEGKHWLKATAVDASGRALAAAEAFFVEPRNTKPPPPPAPLVATPPAPVQSFEEQCRHPATQDAMRGLTIEEHRGPYRVGETALACLRSHVTPRTSNARGLFTIEREGILRREPLVDLGSSGSKLMNISLTDDLYPSANLAFTEEIGRVAPFPSPGNPDPGPPSFGSESQRLAITAPARKLTVTIDTEKEARPGSEIELRLSVKDGDRRPAAAQVAVWAIDEGIEILAPKSAPRPENTFGEQRYSDIVETDTRKNVFFEHGRLRLTKSPSLRQGATTISDRNLVGRSVFRPTAFFLTSVITGANGAASVRARLPDNLTTWKVFAVAATTSDAFGGGEASFTTNKPLMIRPQLPRFLRTGDQFDGTVMIDSLAKEPVEIALSVRASGVLVTKSPGATVTIPAEGHVPVRVPIEAKAVGAGKLVFTVRSTRGPAFQDEVTIDEEVSPFASIESVVVAGETPASKSPVAVNVPLGDLSVSRPDIGGFDYRFSTTPLVGLAASMSALVEYPYGCTEQLTSRLVPLVRLRGMAKDLGVELPSNIDAAVRSSLASLLTHQQPDGGFGFWRESRKSEAWLTVLALGALRAAEQHGHVVPPAAVDAAQKWLEKPTELDPASRAMREDLFAGMGKARPAELRALAADPTLPLFARALTAHALAGVDRALAKSLLDRILSGAQASAAIVTFADEPSLAPRAHLSSSARTTALVLRAMLAIEPQSPLVTKVVRGLLSLRRDGRWPTTQDSAWALTALEDTRALYRPTPGRTKAELLFDGHVVATTEISGAPSGETRTGTLAMSRLLGAPGASIAFASDGTRPLYYEGTLRYARAAPPTSPLDHGITVARSLRPLREGATELRVGDYVVADVLLVTSTARDLVVLDDPIPAGFEPVNGSFASMDQAAPLVTDPALTLTHRELEDDRVVSFFDALPAGATHTRYVLRTIAAGHFAHPPARAECMYAPDVFGRTSSTWVDTR